MPGAVADLTNTLGWTVMNYYAPYWVRYDSLQLSNPPKKEKRESFLEKFPTCNRAPGVSFGFCGVILRQEVLRHP